MFKAFKKLARFKGLRGGSLDLFGKTAERQMERQLIADYINLLDEIVAKLTPVNHQAAVALASVPDEIRGYGHVKEKSLATASKLQAERLKNFLAKQPDKRVA